jgi:hypothetical protein
MIVRFEAHRGGVIVHGQVNAGHVRQCGLRALYPPIQKTDGHIYGMPVEPAMQVYRDQDGYNAGK